MPRRYTVRSKAALQEERELIEYFWRWTFGTPINFEQELSYLLNGYYPELHQEALNVLAPDSRRELPAALVAILARAWQVPQRRIPEIFARFNALPWDEQQRFNKLVEGVVQRELPHLGIPACRAC